MPILKSTDPDKGSRLVGVYLPSDTHRELTLLSIAKGQSKSKIIKTLIEDWILRQKEKKGDREVLREITNRASKRWQIEKMKLKPLTFALFKERLGDELLGKGMLEDHVKIILNEIDISLRIIYKYLLS